MKISKRSLFVVISLMLALSVTALGTVAYMTDQDQVINTFTVGNINIIVDEKNADGVPGPDGIITPARDQHNSYELIPGKPNEKDPRVTVLANSEECYVRMRVEMNCYALLSSITGLTDQMGYDMLDLFVDINNDWQLAGDAEIDTASDVISYEFRYKPVTEGETEKVQASETENKVLQPLFDYFTVPLIFTGKNLNDLANGGFQMDVYGDAIQTEAFNNAEAAWNAFDQQIFGKVPTVPEQPDLDQGGENDENTTDDTSGTNEDDNVTSEDGSGNDDVADGETPNE